MKDMQASLEKLRTDAAEAALIRDLTTDRRKREVFTRLADHFATLAADVERAISTHETEQRAASTDGPFILNVGSWHFFEHAEKPDVLSAHRASRHPAARPRLSFLTTSTGLASWESEQKRTARPNWV